MGTTAALNKYSSSQVSISKIAKAISHPARIAILELLNRQECTCNDIVNNLPLAQSTVSQHLKELKSANLINFEEVPPKTIYKLNKNEYQQTKTMLNSFFNLSQQ